MLRIEMPREELSMPPKVTIGNRERYSTATGVAFINEQLLVSAAFNSKRLYLIALTENGHEILDSVKGRHHPDLLYYKDGMIATSDYPHMEPNGHLSIYDLVDNKIVFRKEITLPNTKAHGCTIVDATTAIVTSNSDFNRGCLYIDIPTGKTVRHFNDFLYYPKDTYLTQDRLFVVTSESLPQVGQKTVIKGSKLYIFNSTTFSLLDELDFHGQTDSLVVVGEDVFVVVQGDDTLVHAKCIDDKLSFVKRIGGFNFPHGIAVYENKIAVTNYGDNTIRIFELDELVNSPAAS